jgi:hypothetical protein
MSDEPQTVYLALDPSMTDPVFVTDDFEVISEWIDNHPGRRMYKEYGVLDADEVRELPDFDP